ncbi:MAG: AIM24 family protein, partial [Methylococcales bacterium]
MPRYQQINEKLIEVSLNGEAVFAKKGAMISYQGNVVFRRSFLAGNGVQDFAMRALTSEGYALMVAEGTGTVYYGYNGFFVSIIQVVNETVFVESDTLLAFDARLRTG